MTVQDKIDRGSEPLIQEKTVEEKMADYIQNAGEFTTENVTDDRERDEIQADPVIAPLDFDNGK